MLEAVQGQRPAVKCCGENQALPTEQLTGVGSNGPVVVSSRWQQTTPSFEEKAVSTHNNAAGHSSGLDATGPGPILLLVPTAACAGACTTCSSLGPRPTTDKQSNPGFSTTDLHSSRCHVKTTVFAPPPL